MVCWNVNKRFYLYSKHPEKFNSLFSREYDIIFISETNLGYDALPEFDKYVLFADPDRKLCNFGGIACYVRNNIASHVFQVKYHVSYISFRIDTCPGFMFVGVYIQPEGARHFKESMFSDLSLILIECHEKGLIPFIGGDFNSRPGNLDSLGDGKWRYNANKDTNQNQHGKTFFRDLCAACKVNPVNGMIYDKKEFQNDFTFVRGRAKSQIDFVLTDDIGRRHISSFQILQHDWHLSDHKPIALHVQLPTDVNLVGLLTRSIDLNYSFNDSSTEIVQFKGNYNYDKINDNLIQCKQTLTTSVNVELQRNNVEAAVDILDAKLAEIHKANKIKSPKTVRNVATKMEDANNAFDDYMNTIDDPNSSNEIINEKLEQYKITRKALTKDVIDAETKKWNDLLRDGDSKRYWSFIDWKGNIKQKKQLTSPDLHEFEVFFEDLYKCDNQTELQEIMCLQSDKEVPALDHPLTENEVQTAFKHMKNSGYDYRLPVLNTLVQSFSLLLVTILNMIFFVKYPVSLACSLLSLIPKTGNLRLPKNYRGIQMMKALACLYDHIIANRLKSWLSFNVNQTAFQKNQHCYTSSLCESSLK